MDWLDIKAFLEAQGAVADGKHTVNITLQGVSLRVSWSEKTDSVGVVGDVATAGGITPREIFAAGAGLKHGKLAVVSDRILLCHTLPADAVAERTLADLLAAMAADVVRLRMQWSMPILAAQG